MRKLFVLLAVFALSGCAVTTPAPMVTPVDLKYCALADQAGFDDDGLNRSVYVALQQLKVQTGASLMALEVGGKLTPAQGIDKLIAADCNAIVAAGEDLAKVALASAKKNSTVRFVSVGDIINTGDSAPNFVALTFNIYQAAYAAGYLAAASAPSAEIATLDVLKTTETSKSIKAFTAGVARYNTEKRSQVKISSLANIQAATQDVVFVLSGNSTALGDWPKAQAGAQKQINIIGYGRDWHEDIRNKNLQPFLLTSVVRNGVTDKVVAAVTASAATQNFDLANGGVGLVSENEIAFPSDFGTALAAIIKDFSEGKVKVG